MQVEVTPKAKEDLLFWQKTGNKIILKKIEQLTFVLVPAERNVYRNKDFFCIQAPEERHIYKYCAPLERNTFFAGFSINITVRWTLIHFPKSLLFIV